MATKRAPLTHERVFEGDFAAEYARRHRGYAEKFGKEFADKLVESGFQQGRILDAGCGPGATAIVLAQAFPQSAVVGIDLSGALLQMANQAAQEAALSDRVTFEKANVQQIPYDQDSFAAVINLQMLHLVEGPVAMLNEMERVLAPGGHLFLADIRRSWLGLLDKIFRTGLTVPEAAALVEQSDMRAGRFASGLLWYHFEV